jgi:protein-tyrosine phosphatase
MDNMALKIFCEVRMPPIARGKLFLHSMPGRYEPLDHTWEHVKAERIAAIVCLAGNDEISVKSDAYYRALQDGTVPCPVIRFEIPDYDVPEDRDVFLSLARDVAHRLLAAENILIHCGAGVGRSGTLAQCVLLVLGQTLNAAYAAVTDAGSWAETPQQRGLIRWCAAEIANRP